MPEQEQSQIQIRYRCEPNGLVLRIPTGPLTLSEITLPEDLMNQIAGAWIESRRQLKKDLEIIQDVNDTKRRENLKLIRH